MSAAHDTVTVRLVVRHHARTRALMATPVLLLSASMLLRGSGHDGFLLAFVCVAAIGAIVIALRTHANVHGWCHASRTSEGLTLGRWYHDLTSSDVVGWQLVGNAAHACGRLVSLELKVDEQDVEKLRALLLESFGPGQPTRAGSSSTGWLAAGVGLGVAVVGAASLYSWKLPFILFGTSALSLAVPLAQFASAKRVGARL